MTSSEATPADASAPPPAAGPSAARGDFEDSVTWSGETEVSASDVLEKERLIRDITAMQDGLRALLARVKTVKADCTKAEADNEMLQTYIDSVTKSLAAKS